MPDPVRLTPHDCNLDYAARVRRGAALLDRVRPGWAREIKLKNLEMQWCTCCILGHLYGTYQEGLAGLAIDDHESAAVLAFNLDDADGSDDPEWDDLANAWRDAIRERLASEGGQP